MKIVKGKRGLLTFYDNAGGKRWELRVPHHDPEAYCKAHPNGYYGTVYRDTIGTIEALDRLAAISLP